MRDKRFSSGAGLGLFIFAVLFLFTAGCTGPLQFTYAPGEAAPVKKVQGRPTVIIKPFYDARDLAAIPGGNRRTIGEITSMVMDMNRSTLTLSEDVTDVARAAFAKELENAGFVVVAGDPALTNSDYLLTGVVKDFRLDIGPRDDISISVMTKLTEKNTGAVVWSDTVSEKRNDYIGMWGETKAHISRYISDALSKVARGSIAGMEEKISAPSSAPGEPAPPQNAPSGTAPQATGKLTVTTDPTRSEVYMGDVYYGLAPVTIDMPPGVYEVTARKKGFREARQKVSVREGQTTELDMTLGKE